MTNPTTRATPARTEPLAVHVAEARGVVDALREAGIDDEESIEISLESETSLAESLTAALASIREREALIRSAADEVDRLMARKLALAEGIVRDKARIADALQRLGRNAKCAYGTVYVVPGQPSARVVSSGEVPPEFTRTKTETRPDLAAIRRALVAGIRVPGAELSNAAPSIGVRS